MKNTLKRFLLVTLVLTLTVSCFSGCGNNSTSTDAGNKKLSISIYDRGLVPTSEGDLSDNRWTKWITEQTGIEIDWVPVPRNEAQQKLNILIAGGEAPDIIVDYSSNFIADLVYQGVLQPVGEHIEKYSKAYKEYLEKTPELLPYVTFDGQMYAFTNKRSSDSIANHAMWIRQDWLDNLNLETPTTIDELVDVAKAFTYDDPDGNGVDDTVGMSLMQWQGIFAALYSCSNLWYLEDGKLTYGPLTERYSEMLRFAQTLYKEGVIDEEFLTDRDFKNQKQMWVTGKSGIHTDNWTAAYNRDLLTNVPDAQPTPLEPVATQFGKSGLWQEAPAQRYVVFSKDMKNPQVGVEFLDWMIDKGWETLMFGEEGVHSNTVDGLHRVIDAEVNKRELDWALDYPILNQWDMLPEWLPLMAAEDELSQKLAKINEQSLNTALKNKFRRDLPYDPTIPEVREIALQFNPKVDEIRMQVMLGNEGCTPEWAKEQIAAEWNRLGGSDVEKAVNEWYESSVKTEG